MKCFNHPDREAVATCQSCGKGLCRECASKHRPCLCDECYQDNVNDAAAMKRLRKKAALADTNREMLTTSLIGLVCAVAFTLFMAKTLGGYDTFGAGDYFGMGLFFFCIPFGWNGISYLESLLPSKDGSILIIPLYILIFWYLIKGFISLVIGIPLFIFQLIKWLVNITRHANEKNKI